MTTITGDYLTATLDLGIQGSTWGEDLTFQLAPGGVPVVITGGTVTCDFKYNKGDATAAASLTCAVVNGASGIWSMILSAAQHAALTKFRGVFDVKIVVGGVTYKPLGGYWKTKRKVTP
jgi:hypothetical protein